jgi:catechol 2,3-dioxygenase-like lactoylglutathione lyase family enzyme
MLGDHTIDVMLLSTDLEVTKKFYGDKIGLEVLLEQEDVFVTFKCKGDSRLVVTKSTTGTSDEQTQAAWRVDDLAAEVADLRARGIEFVDMPEFNSVDGIADVGFALTAAFVDPHRNSIGLLQFKEG